MSEEEEEGAAVRKSRPPDRRLRAATAGVTGVGVARELAKPREEDGKKNSIVTFFPQLKNRKTVRPKGPRSLVASTFWENPYEDIFTAANERCRLAALH